ncbi:uncharacterized protein LOC142337162 [Convolutriloba macropyga]|uniref:uncharacterized protein LOC142337162 n=1 Tax=Convolutriloba macropyga TaxID=536237 RepID=UPI003F520BF2
MRVVASDNGNPSLSSQGVVRVDVLNIELFVIQMTISISFAQFDEATQERFSIALQTECQRTYRLCTAGVIYFERNASKRRRRRSSTINNGQTITAYVYAFSSDLDLSNTEADANFLTADQLLGIFQQAGDGTPVPGLLNTDIFGDFPILSVSAYPKEEKAFLDNVTNRWILAIAIITGVLILAVLAVYVYFHVRSSRSTGTRLTLVKPTYKWRGGGGNRGRGGGDGGRAPKYKRETSRGDEMRRKVKDSNQAKRQSAAVAVAPQTKPDTSKLQQKSLAPVVAPQPQQPAGKPAAVEEAKNKKDNLHAEDDKPDVGKQAQQPVANVNQVFVKEKGAVDQADGGGGGGATAPTSDLDEFNGMAFDPATGKYYAYNNKTGKRRWLRTKEVDIMKAKLNK